MNYFSHYPYQNFSDYNLDWLLKLVKEVNEKLSEYLENSVITFADPITWNITEQYTALTCVIDSDGTAYLSKRPVPAGVDINNTEYWQPIFNYDGNISNLRRNIATLSNGSGVISTALDKDRLVWYLGNLYLTTADLSAGAQLIPDVNIRSITVEEFILSFISEIDTDITNLQGDMTAAQGNITDLQEDMTAAQGDITDLQGDMTAAQGDITDLQEDMTAAQGDITNLKEDVKNHYIVFCTTNPSLNPAGHCSFITHGEHAFLFDLGRYSAYENIKNILKDYNITTIDAVMISHYHRDHDGWPDSGSYSHWSNDFDMTNTVFYIPNDPPAVVGSDWSSNTKAYLQASFPNNQFITPPNYESIEWNGYTITTFNNTAADYAYYAAQGISNYNEYSTIAYIERNGCRVLQMADAGGQAETRNIPKFKPATVMTVPHHGLNGDGVQQVADIVRPQYMFMSDAYAAYNIAYRSPDFIEAVRNGAVIINNVSNYPYAVAGNMDDFQTLTGSCIAPQSNYDTRRKIYINENVDVNSYQDGSVTYPFKSWRMIQTLTTDITEVELLSDITAMDLMGTHFIHVKGNGHTVTNSVITRGITIELENIKFNTVRFSNGVNAVIDGNVSFLGASYIWESRLCANAAITHAQPISYRNSFVSIAGIVNTGTGTIA